MNTIAHAVSLDDSCRDLSSSARVIGDAKPCYQANVGIGIVKGICEGVQSEAGIGMVRETEQGKDSCRGIGVCSLREDNTETLAAGVWEDVERGECRNLAALHYGFHLWNRWSGVGPKELQDEPRLVRELGPVRPAAVEPKFALPLVGQLFRGEAKPILFIIVPSHVPSQAFGEQVQAVCSQDVKGFTSLRVVGQIQPFAHGETLIPGLLAADDDANEHANHKRRGGCACELEPFAHGLSLVDPLLHRNRQLSPGLGDEGANRTPLTLSN